jgi:hypothetical protein
MIAGVLVVGVAYFVGRVFVRQKRGKA